MTGSLQIVERMRWMSALIAAAAGAVAVAIALGATSGKLRTVVPGSSAGSSPGTTPSMSSWSMSSWSTVQPLG